MNRRLVTEVLESRQMLDGEDLVRFVLTARDVETDELLPNAEGVAEVAANSEQTLNYEIPINEVFKLEVAVQDLRDRGSDFGVFRAVTDIVVETKGVLEPAIGEVQEIILARTILDSGLPAGQVDLFLEDDPNEKITSTLSAFLGANPQAIEQNVANAIVALNDQVTSVSQITVNAFNKPDAGPDGVDGYAIEIIYDDPSFIGVDMPMLSASVTVGSVLQPDIENEFDVYVNGTVNGERMYHFFETQSRNAGGVPVYGQTRVIGGFVDTDNAVDVFDEVGGLGPVSSGGIRDGISEFDRTIAYDAFAIPVIARSLANDVVVRLDAPDIGDKILIYGTEADKEGVPDDQIQFGGNSRFFLDVTPPVPKLDASDASQELVEDQAAVSIDLSTLVDADPGALTYSLVSTATLGTASINDTTLTYTPNANAFGADVIAYRVTRDESGDAADGQITFNIASVNDAPVANDDERSTNEDTPLSLTVAGLLENDTDLDPDDQLTLVSVGNAANGNVVRDGNSVTYTPLDNFFGEDSFNYTIRDITGVQRTATVRVDVIAVNDPPTATGETSETSPDTPISFAIADLLSNDSAGPLESNQDLTITEVGGLIRDGSSVVIDGDFVRYVPAPGFAGNDGFTYTVSDGLESVTASVAIDVSFTVEAVNFELPTESANDITVRRNDGTFLEIVDNSTNPSTRLLRRPLDTITSLTLTGAPNEIDQIHVDHAAGGLITFIGNTSSIEILGGESAGDEFRISGITNSNALIAEADSQSPSMLVGLVANLQLGALGSTHTIRGFETTIIADVRQISVPSSSILDVDTGTLSLDSELPVNLSRTTRVDGGTLSSTSPLALGSSDQIAGNGNVVGSLVAPLGSTISADGGNLTLGTSDSTESIDIAGQLNTLGNTITLVDQDSATIRGTVALGGANQTPGSLASTTGITIQPGTQVSGNGSIVVGNETENGLTNNGSIIGGSTAAPILINGTLSGSGSVTNVEIAGQWRPADLINNRLDGNVALTSTATMNVDIGGTEAGTTHDLFRFNPSIQLDGTLKVDLVSDFSPSAGHQFQVISGTSSLTGAFETLNLPELVDGLKWDVQQTNTALTLRVVLDGAALDENVNVEVGSEGQIIVRGKDDQPIPIAGDELELDVVPTQHFESPQTWFVQPSHKVDGEVIQIATNGSVTLRIAGARWTNFVQRFDINASGSVTAVDALVIINELNGPRYSSSETSVLEDPDAVPLFPNIFYDANGDGRVSAVDALQVINRLIQLDAGGEPVDALSGGLPADAITPAAASTTGSLDASLSEAVNTLDEAVGVASPLTPRENDMALVNWLEDDESYHRTIVGAGDKTNDSDHSDPDAEGSRDLDRTLDLLSQRP